MPKLLRVYRVAEILDCTKRNIYMLIESQALQAVRLGARGIRITNESLQEYLKKFANNHQKDSF